MQYFLTLTLAGLGLLAAVGIGGDKVLAPLNQLFAFANLSDQQLYELTLTLVGPTSG